jgi:MFS family permease
VGSGILSHAITAVVGGDDKVAWITGVLTFHPVILGPVVCKAADFWGRKWFMVVSLLMGMVGCIVTSRATSIGMAIAGQAITGFSGINQALPQAVTAEVLPRKYRSWAQVMIYTPGAAAALIGTYLTGAMTKSGPSGFRNYWYLCAALFFFAACNIAYFYRPPTREQQRLNFREKIHALDLPGCLLLATAMLGLTLALNWSSNPYPWNDVHVLVSLIIGGCAAILLVVYAIHYRRDGIFHHDLFRNRNYCISLVVLCGEGVAFIGVNNYLPFQLTAMYGDGPSEVSNIFAIAWLTWLVATPLVGWCIARTRKARLFVILALGSFVLYFALMASTNPSTRDNIWGYNVFLGLGQAGGVLALTTIAQLSIPADLIASATGLIVASRTFGACIGLVVFNAILNSVLTSRLAPAIGDAALSAGLPSSSLPEFLSAFLAGSSDTSNSAPGASEAVVQAATIAMRHVYNIGFRDGYAGAAAIIAAALIGSVPYSLFRGRVLIMRCSCILYPGPV